MELIAHPKGPNKPNRYKKSHSSNLLAQAFRLAEDIEPRHADIVAECLGGDADLILEAGYRVVSRGFLDAFRRMARPLPDFVSRATILIPTRDTAGAIIGMHDQCGRWLFGPTVHISNSKRATCAPVRIRKTTAQSDSLALAENVCCLVAHGLPLINVIQQLTGDTTLEAAA